MESRGSWSKAKQVLKADRRWRIRMLLLIPFVVVCVLVIPLVPHGRSFRGVPYPTTLVTAPKQHYSSACTPANLTKAVFIMGDNNFVDTLTRAVCAGGWAMADGTLIEGTVVANLFSWSKTLGWLFYGDFAFKNLEVHARHYGMPESNRGC